MARRVGNLQLGVYAAPSYLERACAPLHPQELEGTHHRVVGFLSARTGKAYLAAGLGVLWLPDYMAKAHLACGEPACQHQTARVHQWVAELMAQHAPISERCDS